MKVDLETQINLFSSDVYRIRGMLRDLDRRKEYHPHVPGHQFYCAQYFCLKATIEAYDMRINIMKEELKRRRKG